MKSKFFRLTVFLIIVSMYVSSTIVYGVTLRIDSATQEKTNWCWAACAEMVGKWENPTSTRTQKQIVAYIKGSSLLNVTGTASETEAAAEYASNFVADYYTTGVFSKNSVKNMINGYNNPFIVGCRYVSSGGAHASCSWIR